MNHKITIAIMVTCIVVKVIALSFIVYKLIGFESEHRIVLYIVTGIVLIFIIADFFTLIIYKKNYGK